jgi:hypothetical protein
MSIVQAGEKWAVSAALVAALCLFPALGRDQARAGSPELAGLAPRLDAWTRTEEPRSFFPESLFEYIDGAAESYLSYDFRELLVMDLEKKGTEATLTLEIYDMGTPLNAFGIFGAERYPENEAVPVGDLGYLEGEALNFLAGRFYVKLLAFGLGEGTAASLRDVGVKVAAGVKPTGGLPALVAAFPKEALVARSEKYIKQNFMGYEFLRHGFAATYKAGDKEFEGFFVEAGSEPAAEEMRARLLEALARDGQPADKVEGGAHVRNRYGQNLYLGRVRGVLFGVMRLPDGLEAAGLKLFSALGSALAKGAAPK